MRTRELPPPLPPEKRTVGQLVAETIRFYGEHFWRALPLGIPVAVADQLSVGQHIGDQMLAFWAATPLFVVAYVWACRIVHDRAPTRTAFTLAVLIYLPFPALRGVFLFALAGVAWFALIGLAVPAAMVERRSFREALVRGRQLGTADYVHALGSLAALVVVVGLSESTLSALLHSQGENGHRVALALSDLVLSPMLFLGGALLYLDQAARVVGSARAALHPSLDAQPAGHHDAQVEP